MAVFITGARRPSEPKGDEIDLATSGTGNATYCYLYLNGTKYNNGGFDIGVHPGDVLIFGVYGPDSSHAGSISINGEAVLTVTDGTTKTYAWVVPDAITAVNVDFYYTTGSYPSYFRQGVITVTTE